MIYGLLVILAIFSNSNVLHIFGEVTEEDKQLFENEKRLSHSLDDQTSNITLTCAIIAITDIVFFMDQSFCTSYNRESLDNDKMLKSQYTGLMNVIDAEEIKEVLDTCTYLLSIEDFTHLKGCTDFYKTMNNNDQQIIARYYEPIKISLQENPEIKQKVIEYESTSGTQRNLSLLN